MRKNAEILDFRFSILDWQSPIQNPKSKIKNLHRVFDLSGQATLEYALFVAVVVAALVAMNTYVRRAIQANAKSLEAAVNAEAGAPVNLN